MDSYRQVNTAEKAVITTLGYQLDRQPVPDEPINPSAFLPNFPALDDPFFGAIVNKVLSWLKTYGEICSVVVATILLFRLVAWIVGIILRLSTISLSANPLMHVLWACCPALHGFLEAPARWCRNLACCQVQERPESLRAGRGGVPGVPYPDGEEETTPILKLRPLTEPDGPPPAPTPTPIVASAPVGQVLQQATEEATAAIYPGLVGPSESVAATLPPVGGWPSESVAATLPPVGGRR